MKDIKKMNDKDLVEFVAKKREEIRTNRFNASARDVRAVRANKKDIARALGELTSRSKQQAA